MPNKKNQSTCHYMLKQLTKEFEMNCEYTPFVLHKKAACYYEGDALIAEIGISELKRYGLPPVKIDNCYIKLTISRSASGLLIAEATYTHWYEPWGYSRAFDNCIDAAIDHFKNEANRFLTTAKNYDWDAEFHRTFDIKETTGGLIADRAIGVHYVPAFLQEAV